MMSVSFASLITQEDNLINQLMSIILDEAQRRVGAQIFTKKKEITVIVSFFFIILDTSCYVG